MEPIERHPDDLPPPDADPAGLGSRVPKGLLWALSLLVVLLVIASWVALSNDPPKTAGNSDPVVHLGTGTDDVAGNPLLAGNTMIGKPFPAASYEKFTGGTASLGDLKGTPVVVNLWASNCPPCITEMPDLEKAHQQLGATVAFVGLDVQDTDDAARELARRTGVTYPLGFDRNNLAVQLDTIGLPTTFLIDRNGTIVYAHLRAITTDELLQAVKEHLQT